MQELYARVISAEPLPYGPGEWQADPADLARMERELEGSVPSESTASDSSSTQQDFRHHMDNTGYKADPRPVSDQRSK